jgi:hypothetical protein
MTDPYHSMSSNPQQPEQPQQPPLPPDLWRPSEADRKTVADRLRTAVDEGRLNLTEYDQRLRTAEMAGTMEQLNGVVADLPGAPEQVLVQIGEIAVTNTTVYTPSGPIPLRGSQWAVQDQWLSEQKTPTWAIVLAIVGVFVVCLFSLLLLLVKETRFHGTVNVTVTNGNQQYAARIPVYHQQQVHHIYNQVNYVRSLTMR